MGVGAHHLHSITRSNRGPTVSRKKHKKKKKGYRRAAAAMAMQWSIDLDRALRSRHPATRLRAVDAVAPRLRELGASPPAAVPPAVASALGVLPSEPRLFAHTILLRLATHFATADNAVRARILRALLLLGLDGSLPMTMACVAAEPQHQVAVLARVKAAYDAGCPRARALALRMFGCLAHLAHHSLHLRSLILSTFSSSNALQVVITSIIHLIWLGISQLT